MFFNGSKNLIDLSFTPIFIAGPGRSGTTVLHATICSDYESGNTNQFVGEASYLMKIIKVYYDDFVNFKGMTYSYFNEKEEEYFLYCANLVRQVLNDMWIELGKPKNLVLKAPALVQYYPFLSQACPEAKFIMTIRNPLDIISSMKDVNRKDPKAKNFDETFIKEVCDGFLPMFTIYSKSKELLKGRTLFVKYEDFIQKKCDSEIEEFTGTKIIENRIWHSEFFRADQGWLTEKYKNPRESSSIDNYKTNLTQEEQEIVINYTNDLMREYDYLAKVS